jgi:hypothetical protein
LLEKPDHDRILTKRPNGPGGNDRATAEAVQRSKSQQKSQYPNPPEHEWQLISFEELQLLTARPWGYREAISEPASCPGDF